VQLLSFEDQRHFIVLLCLKAGGALDRVYGSSATRERVILSALRIDSISLVDLKNRLMEIAVIDADWQPTAWEKRQESKDKTAAERMRRSREAQRNVTESVTESVTRNVTVGVTRDVTPLEEKRGEEKKKKREQKLAVVFNPSNVTGLDLTAWADWLAYRQSISKPLKEASLAAAAAELAALGDRQAASVRRSIASGYQGLYEKHSDTSGGYKRKPGEFVC
jgi:autotransporter translocation and assembly factor TamB